MGFFQTFWSWLNGQLASYIGDNTARVATILEPAAVTMAILYVMAWGYLQMTGRLEEPLLAGLKRIVTLGVVFGCGLQLWLFNSVIVDTFYKAPTQLAAAVVGAGDPVGTIDTIWEQGGAVAGFLSSQHAVLSGDIGFMLVAAAVWLVVGLLCVYTMFLIALSSVAQAVLLALGPAFIVMALFEATRRLFMAWIAQLINYALITVLSVMAGALLLRIVASYAAQTVGLGTGLHLVDAFNLLLMCALVLLFMRQVMPIAAGLAGGVALSSFGLTSRAIGWSGVQAQRAGALGVRSVGAFLTRRAASANPASVAPRQGA